ncbi:MAG TPA: DUF4190 domain-containing protein [Candidatus Limnocylindrales bacterium]|jgi:hypothetical protein|nr:DUF4190 domain-containing protein [Candidatus Limnocylindrales bacterium]
MSAPPQLPTSLGQPKTSGLAIWSLVLGILGVFCFSIIAGIPAVIFGHTALSRIKRSGGMLEGNGLAIGGLVTGYLSIAMIPLIAMMAAIAIPNFVKARNVAMTNMCVNNLRQIDAAKQMWAVEKNKDGSQTPTGQDLTPYLKRDFTAFVCPAGGTYSINSVGEKPACSVAGHELPKN